MVLSELETGSSGCILEISGRGAMRRRLLDLGLTPGTRVTAGRVAPGGDPIELKLRGGALMLRRAEAARVSLRREEQD